MVDIVSLSDLEAGATKDYNHIACSLHLLTSDKVDVSLVVAMVERWAYLPDSSWLSGGMVFREQC